MAGKQTKLKFTDYIQNDLLLWFMYMIYMICKLPYSHKNRGITNPFMKTLQRVCFMQGKKFSTQYFVLFFLLFLVNRLFMQIAIAYFLGKRKQEGHNSLT